MRAWIWAGLLLVAACGSDAKPARYTGPLNANLIADTWIDEQDAKFEQVTTPDVRMCVRRFYQRLTPGQLELMADVRTRDDIPKELMDAWLDAINDCGV